LEVLRQRIAWCSGTIRRRGWKEHPVVEGFLVLVCHRVVGSARGVGGDVRQCVVDDVRERCILGDDDPVTLRTGNLPPPEERCSGDTDLPDGVRVGTPCIRAPESRRIAGKGERRLMTLRVREVRVVAEDIATLVVVICAGSYAYAVRLPRN